MAGDAPGMLVVVGICGWMVGWVTPAAGVEPAAAGAEGAGVAGAFTVPLWLPLERPICAKAGAARVVRNKVNEMSLRMV
jgi:hypothetical protein